jgi:Mitochondrial carrier protein
MDGDLRLAKEWFTGGVANAFTSAFLNPLDVAKTRAQVITVKRVELRVVLSNLYREGGIIGMWSPGLVASCTREILSSGPRAGFYVPVRDYLAATLQTSSSPESDDPEPTETPFAVKALAAMMTGTLGSLIANPIDVVKIRLMADPTAYPTTFSAIPQIFRSEGVHGLYRGVVPSTLRGAFIAAGELATYDHTKNTIRTIVRVDEGLALHSLASMITGVVAATVAAPFDIVKTRTMASGELRASPLRVFVNILRHEGPLTLFKGWLPSYLRLGPHAMICFPIFEQLRRLVGLEYL